VSQRAPQNEDASDKRENGNYDMETPEAQDPQAHDADQDQVNRNRLPKTAKRMGFYGPKCDTMSRNGKIRQIERIARQAFIYGLYREEREYRR